MRASTVHGLIAALPLAAAVENRTSIPFTAPYNPIVVPTANGVAPTHNVSLYYGDSGSDTVVAVHLGMKGKAVALENTNGLQSVDCSSTGVTVKFNDASSYNTAKSAWADTNGLTLITNHLGECDESYSRGFFAVDDMIWSPYNQTVVAKASRQDVAYAAGNATFSFDSAIGLQRRDATTYNLVETTVSLPSNTALVSSAQANVTLNTAYLSVNVTATPNVAFNLWTMSFTTLTVDLALNLLSAIKATAAVTANQASSSSNSRAPTIGALVNIPGILVIQPNLQYSAGANISSSAYMNSTTVGGTLSITGGKIHVDALTSANNYVSNLTPIATTITPSLLANASASLQPYFDVGIGLTVTCFGTAVTLGAVAAADLHVIAQASTSSLSSSKCSTGHAYLDSDLIFGASTYFKNSHGKYSNSSIFSYNGDLGTLCI